MENQYLVMQKSNIKVSKEHSKRCKKYFDEIISGKEIYVRFEKKIISTGNLEGSYENSYIRAEIVTENILQYDLENLLEVQNPQEGQTHILQNYRPYMVSFLIEIPQIVELPDETWYVAKFQNEQSGETVIISEAEEVYEGALEYSASPVQYEKGDLIIFKNKSISPKILKDINTLCKDTAFSITSDSTVETILNDIWGGSGIKTIDCYNLGKGNSDYIRGYNSRILYDIGYSYQEYPKRKGKYNYYRACNAIRQARPRGVILSHWDMDHIIGCVYAKQRIFDVPWIAPNLEGNGSKPSTNAYRLARYLNCLNHLYLIDRSRGALKVAHVKCYRGYIDLYLGGGKDSKITKVNSEGLYLDIYSRDLHIVLAGDVPYKSMEPAVWNSTIDYLHVPHHCSDMSLTDLKKYTGYGSAAIVSTNWKKRKNTSKVLERNMNNDHRKVLETKFEKIICTVGDDINRINQYLSYQIDVRKKAADFR